MERNEGIKAALAAALAGRGYLVLAGGKAHASIALVKGWGGHLHPRPLCQGHTSRKYYWTAADQSQPVTCQRCLAGMAKRNLQP